MRSSRRNAATNADVGAHSAGMATLAAMPWHCTPVEPDCTSAAPVSPPMSACDDEDGSPNHHVSRFQAIAPITAASTVFGVARPESITPLPTVFATAVAANA